MAIRVGHSANAGAVAGAAFAGAQGQARQRYTLAQLAMAERERARRAAEAEAERQRQFAAARQQQAFENEQFGNYISGLRQQGNMRLNAELQSGLAGEAFQRHELAADNAQLRGRQDLVFGLTTRQRMDLDQLADAEAKALASSDYTPEEKAELRIQFDARRAGIRPVARPKPKTPAQIFAERSFTDPKTGNVFAIEPDGSLGKPIYERPERLATWADHNTAWKTALEHSMNPETGALDMSRARAIFAEIMEGREAHFEEPSAPTAAPVAAPEPQQGRLAAAWSAITGSRNEPGTLANTFLGPAIEASDYKDLAAVDEQLGVEREALRRFEAEIGPEREKLKANKPSSVLGVRRTEEDLEILSRDLETKHRKRVAEAKEKIGLLEKRRELLTSKKNEAEGAQVFLEILRKNGVR